MTITTDVPRLVNWSATKRIPPSPIAVSGIVSFFAHLFVVSVITLDWLVDSIREARAVAVSDDLAEAHAEHHAALDLFERDSNAESQRRTNLFNR